MGKLLFCRSTEEVHTLLRKIGVCLRSSTSPAWPVPTERRVAGGKSIYNYEYYLIQVEKNNVMAGAGV